MEISVSAEDKGSPSHRGTLQNTFVKKASFQSSITFGLSSGDCAGFCRVYLDTDQRGRPCHQCCLRSRPFKKDLPSLQHFIAHLDGAVVSATLLSCIPNLVLVVIHLKCLCIGSVQIRFVRVRPIAHFGRFPQQDASVVNFTLTDIIRMEQTRVFTKSMLLAVFRTGLRKNTAKVGEPWKTILLLAEYSPSHSRKNALPAFAARHNQHSATTSLPPQCFRISRQSTYMPSTSPPSTMTARPGYGN